VELPPIPPPPPWLARAQVRSARRARRQHAGTVTAAAVFAVQAGLLAWDLAGGLTSGWSRVLGSTAYWWLAGAFVLDFAVILLEITLRMSVQNVQDVQDAYYTEVMAADAARWEAAYYRGRCHLMTMGRDVPGDGL
jgi:hypothetical protein